MDGARNHHRDYRVADHVKKAVSSLLDATVVGGFSRIGWEVRSRLSHFDRPGDMDLRGRRIVVTGPTSGLGRETARMLASAGADLVLVGRDPVRTGNVADELAGLGAGTMTPVIADMADLSSVSRASHGILGAGARVDCIVHNAGALLKERTLTAQGHETTVAAHVLGPHLMTRILLDAVASSGGRVVTVSSGGMYSAALPSSPRLADESNDLRGFDGTRQYAVAKRMQVTLNEMWAERQPAVWFAAMHPGWADTPGVRTSLPGFRRVTGPLLRTEQQGADTIAWLAGVETTVGESGGFWCDREIRSIHRLGSTRASDTPANREALWKWCGESTDPFLPRAVS